MAGNLSGTVLGIERLVGPEQERVSRRQVGLLAHPASVDHDFVHALDLLLRAGARVERLFGPEHGFMGEAQDMEAVERRSVHPSGIPLKSLYGADAATLAPSADDLAGLDALIVDLQDVGARYYTFVWTALLALRACREAGIEMVVTDRPNPIGGQRVEGAPQSDGYLSFVGLKPVAVRHGMTVGELLTMVAADEGLSAHLTVVKMTGWRRDRLITEIDAPWVMPSPNMPTPDTATVYPGMCLIEGTEVSEGRGTTRPFELVGAPGIDGIRLAARLDSCGLPGVFFRPVSFKPGFQKHKNRTCDGVQLHVRDPRIFLPYRTGVALLLALRMEAGDAFAWRHAPYEFVANIPAVDLLTGSDAVRTLVDQGAALDDIAATWEDGEKGFAAARREYLLYP